MSNKKGDRNERKARAAYESAGYRVRPFREWKYGGKDGFGLFDFLAIHPTRKPRLVQVKSNGTGGVLGSFCDAARAEFPWPEYVEFDFVICYDYHGFRLVQPADDGYVERVDEREYTSNIGVELAAYLSENGEGDEPRW